MASTNDTKKPRVALGLLTFGPPGTEKYSTRLTSLDDFNECLDYYQSRGYHEVDTARTYVNGEQEAWTKQARWKERGLSLATKWFPYNAGEHSRAKVRAALEKSLRELDTDCVDIFYLHAPDRSVPFLETLEACDELYREGKFKKLGMSNYAAWEVAEFCVRAEQRGLVKPSIYQAMYNCATRAIEEELVPCCRKYGLELMVYNPLAGGLLSGKYQSKEQSQDSGRFSNVDPVVGQMYRDRFMKDNDFEALKLIQPVAEKHGLTLLEVAFRWLVHHSKLKITDGNDGLVIGISSLSQLKTNLSEIEKEPLPQEVVDTLDLAWQMTKGTCVRYWR